MPLNSSINIDQLVKLVLNDLENRTGNQDFSDSGLTSRDQSAAPIQKQANGFPKGKSVSGALLEMVAAEAANSDSLPGSRVKTAENESVISVSLTDDSEIELTVKLITLEVVQNKHREHPAARRWFVPAGTVITPSARDELRRQQIEIVSGPKQNIPAVKHTKSTPGDFDSQSESGDTVLALHLSETEAAPRAVTRILEQKGSVVSFQNSCIVQTTQELKRLIAINPQSRIVLLTHYQAVAMIMISRQLEFRPIYGTSVQQMETEADMVNANVLIVDPKEVNPFQLQQIVQKFVELKPTKTPDFLR